MQRLKYISIICAAVISIGTFGITGISAEEKTEKTVTEQTTGTSVSTTKPATQTDVSTTKPTTQTSVSVTEPTTQTSVSATEQTTKTDASKLYSIKYDMDGATGRIDQTDPVAEGEDVKISMWSLKLDGYLQSAWTDGENTYKKGQVIKMPSHDITLKPVWTRVFRLTYEDLEQYGYTFVLTNRRVAPGTEIELKNFAMHNGKAEFNGWLVNGEHYDPFTKFVMPEKDTYVCVDWLDPIKLTYSVGTSDGAISTKEVTFEKYPGSKIELPDKSRLSRLGYKLVGWYDPLTDKSYKLEQTYTVPDKDTVIVGVWEPIKILMEFDANGGTGKMDNIIQTYNTDLKLPECQFTKEGSKLLAWNAKDKYYAPESDFLIRIDNFGEGVKFKAVWIDESINPGDLDGNQKCDITDMTLLSLSLLKDYTLSEEASKNADVVRDGEINLADLSTYKQYLMHENIILGLEGKKD